MAAEPSGTVSQRLSSLANPSGSRARAIAATRWRLVKVSRKGRPGRIASPVTSSIIPVPRRAASGPRSSRAGRPPLIHRAGRSRQSAASSAPLAAHRSCQVLPGRLSSQASSWAAPAFRLAWLWVLPIRNGGLSSRPSSCSRGWQVTAQVPAAGRGGNLSSSDARSPWPPTRRRSLAGTASGRAGACGPDVAVTIRASRKGPPAIPAGIAASQRPPGPPRPQPGRRPGGRDGPERSRSRPRWSGWYRSAW